jgi:predicted RNase H-like nuclease
MSEIKIESDAMQAIVSKAILEGIDADQKQAILEQAVAALIKPRGERGYGKPEPTTPLQDAFDMAVRRVVNEVANEVIADNSDLRDKVREMVVQAMSDTLKDPGTKLQGAVREAVAENLVVDYR